MKNSKESKKGTDVAEVDLLETLIRSLGYRCYHDDHDVVPDDQKQADADALTLGTACEGWRPTLHCSYCRCCMGSLDVAPSDDASPASSLQFTLIHQLFSK